MRDSEKVAVARVADRPVVEGVRRGKADPKHNSAVLKNAARPQERGADGANAGLGRTACHLLQPSFVQRLDVVVQQQQEIAGGERRAGVDQAGEVERTAEAQYVDAFRSERIEVVEGRGIGRPVVDHDQLMRVEIDRPPQRVQTRLQEVEAVASRHQY